jgi:hypothetical protein
LYKYLHGAYVLSRFRGQPHWGPQKGEEGILCLKDSREGNVVEGGIEGTLGKGEEGMGREVCRGEGDSEEGCIQGHGRDWGGRYAVMREGVRRDVCRDRGESGEGICRCSEEGGMH